jgi:nucleoside-diphosphate-sugar epimerase
MKTVLVTGAAGFIGAQVCEQLLSNHVQVVGVDNLNDYYDVTLKEYRLSRLNMLPGFEFRKLDIEDRQALSQLFKSFQFDTVFNLAARAGVRYSMENPHVYMATNAVGNLNLLDEMLKNGVKKFVLASTSSLYAGQKMPFTEDLPVNTPISPYAASKKAAEVMAYTYHYLYGMDVTVLRYFTVYGPAGRPDMSIFRFIKWIDTGEPIELFGDGLQSRDFTYVDDIAQGTLLAAKSLGFEIINLGGGKNPISINYVIEYIEKSLGKKAVIRNRDFHKADLKETWADISKAERLLGWKPKISIEEGLDRAIEWYKVNQKWIRTMRL